MKTDAEKLRVFFTDMCLAVLTLTVCAGSQFKDGFLMGAVTSRGLVFSAVAFLNQSEKPKQ